MASLVNSANISLTNERFWIKLFQKIEDPLHEASFKLTPKTDKELQEQNTVDKYPYECKSKNP